MELIDKADVVAEIKRIMDAENESINSFEHHRNTSEKQRYNARMALLERILSFLNTLEVKEVDYRPMDKDFERDAVSFCIDNGLNITPRTAKIIAKHFFELGLKVNCPITASDRGMAEEIIINLKKVEKDYLIDLTKEIEWLRNKTKKGN